MWTMGSWKTRLRTQDTSVGHPSPSSTVLPEFPLQKRNRHRVPGVQRTWKSLPKTACQNASLEGVKGVAEPGEDGTGTVVSCCFYTWIIQWVANRLPD